jgi:hypothetical protein
VHCISRTLRCAARPLAARAPLAALTRHRAFLADRRRRNRIAASTEAVARVLRRASAITSISLGVFAPQWLAAAPRARAGLAPGARHLRLPAALVRATVQRLCERHTHTVLIHNAAMAPVRASAEIAATPARPAPSVRRATQLRRDRHADYPRLPLTLVQSRPHAADTSVLQAQAVAPRAATPYGAMPAFAAHGAGPASLPTAELARVTDHVLRTLNRRALSLRERTGHL